MLVEIAAGLFIAIVLVNVLGWAIIMSLGKDGVAYAVHAGSFAAGAIAAIIWKTTYMGADEKLIEFKRLAFGTE
jgi:hypothetical protein